MNIITAAAAAVAVIGLIILFGTLKVTRDAASDARFATEEANRAWIAPVAPVMGFPNRDGDAVYPILQFDNDGRDPATKGAYGYRYDTVDAPPSQDFRRITTQNRVQDNFCPDIRQTIPEPAVWPTHGGAGVVTGGPKDTYRHSVRWNRELASGMKTVRVEGCFSYVTFAKRRYSSFCFVFSPTVTQKGEDGKPLMMGLSCNGGGFAN